MQLPAEEGVPAAKQRQGRIREEGAGGSLFPRDDLTNRNSISGVWRRGSWKRTVKPGVSSSDQMLIEQRRATERLLIPETSELPGYYGQLSRELSEDND